MADEPGDLVGPDALFAVDLHELVTEALTDARRLLQPDRSLGVPWYVALEVVVEKPVGSTGEAVVRSRSVRRPRRERSVPLSDPPPAEVPVRSARREDGGASDRYQVRDNRRYATVSEDQPPDLGDGEQERQAAKDCPQPFDRRHGE